MQYYIYQNGEKIKTVDNAKTVVITGLEAHTKYEFAVSAFNGLRESEKSNVVSVTTSDIPATSITLTIPANIELGQNITAKITLTPPETTDTVSYKSSDDSVATIGGDGSIKPLKTGNVTFTATTSSGRSATAKVTIYEALVDVKSLVASNVTPTSVTLNWG